MVCKLQHMWCNFFMLELWHLRKSMIIVDHSSITKIQFKWYCFKKLGCVKCVMLLKCIKGPASKFCFNEALVGINLVTWFGVKRLLDLLCPLGLSNSSSLCESCFSNSVRRSAPADFTNFLLVPWLDPKSQYGHFLLFEKCRLLCGFLSYSGLLGRGLLTRPEQLFVVLRGSLLLSELFRCRL